MQSDTPPLPPDAIAAPAAVDEGIAGLPAKVRPDGTLVIDLTQLVPKSSTEECADEPVDPLNPEIVVCKTTGPTQRLGPKVGPVDDGFGSAIPRARIKLTDTASAEANLIKQGVGGVDADGAEVRVKIDF